MHLWLSFDDLVLFHLIDYTIFGACFSMILFLIGHHSGPIFGSYLLPFPTFGAISGTSFGLFSCILHLFSDFSLLFAYVSIFLHKFWCNFLVPLLACFFAFCIFFSDFFLLFAYVSLFFAQILVQFSGASFGMVFCILHFFLYFFFLIVILGHIFGLRLAIFDMELN